MRSETMLIKVENSPEVIEQLESINILLIELITLISRKTYTRKEMIERLKKMKDVELLKPERKRNQMLILHSTSIIKRIMVIQEALPELIQRREFLDSIQEDYNYISKTKNENFEFRTVENALCQINTEKNGVLINYVFGGLYEKFRDMKYSDKLNYGKKLVNDFTLNNFESKDLSVLCPTCMGELTDIEIDHYFPRSKFPILSIHPNNLMPICSQCNGVNHDGKGKKIPTSPIDDRNINKPGSINNIYIPYLDSFFENIDVLVIKDDDRNEKFRIMDITSDAQEEVKLKNYNNLFSLEKRWSKYVSIVQKNILSSAKDEFSYKDLTDESLIAFLRNKFLDRYEEKIQIRPRHILYASYATHLINSMTARKSFSTLLKRDFKKRLV